MKEENIGMKFSKGEFKVNTMEKQVQIKYGENWMMKSSIHLNQYRE